MPPKEKKTLRHPDIKPPWHYATLGGKNITPPRHYATLTLRHPRHYATLTLWHTWHYVTQDIMPTWHFDTADIYISTFLHSELQNVLVCSRNSNVGVQIFRKVHMGKIFLEGYSFKKCPFFLTLTLDFSNMVHCRDPIFFLWLWITFKHQEMYFS